MNEQAVAIREAEGVVAWSPRQLLAQVNLVQEVMREAMKEGEHFGVIPGTERKDKNGKDISKPSLLQPGAQKLCMTFRMAPEYVVHEKELGAGHREYRIDCILKSITSGAVIGSGVGVCSTMETKYRYRQGERLCPHCGKPAIIKGKQEWGGGWVCFERKGGCKAKFKDGDPAIEGQKVGRVENPDIADTYNTVLKMGKKRAYVDATITALAVSDLFTQDLEDAPEAEKNAKPESPAATTAPPKEEPTPPGETGGAPPAGGPLSDTEALYVKISELMEGAGWTKAKLTSYINKTYQGSMGDLTKLSQANLEALAMYLSTEQRQRPLV